MLQRILLRIIRFYQKGISPFTPSACRFTPTCSAYAVESLERHGTWRGSFLALRRLVRCHPFGGKGWDPVPREEGSEGLGDPRPAPGGGTTTDEPSRSLVGDEATTRGATAR